MADSREETSKKALESGKIVDFIRGKDFVTRLAGMELILHTTSKAAEQEAGGVLEHDPAFVDNLCKMGTNRNFARMVSGYNSKECVEACLRRSDHFLAKVKDLDADVVNEYAEGIASLSAKRNELPELGENGRFEDKGFDPSKDDISLAHEILRGVVNGLKEMSRADHESNSAHSAGIEALDKVIAESSNVLELQGIVGANVQLGNAFEHNVQRAGNRPRREGCAAGERGASGGRPGPGEEGGPGPGEEGGPAGNDVGIG